MPHFEFNSLTLLLIQMATILIVARIFGILMRRLGQPSVIAEVLAGIVLGPSLLGWLWPETMGLLFPTSSMPILKMLSQVGLIFFMFLIGLELNPKLLEGRARSSLAISHTSIIFPFALGAGAAWWLYQPYAPADVSFASFTLFLGISLSVTAFPVLARILSERHLLNSRIGAISIACAAVDDVTAWCLLAFVVAIARSQGVVQGIWTSILSLLFIGAMFFAARPFLKRLGGRIAGGSGLTPNVVLGVLLLLFVCSTLTEMIGIHALFGAFLFGVVLPKDNCMAEALADKLETIAVMVLLPLFFAFSGLRTQIGLINSLQEWLVTAGIIFLATLGKFGGSTVAARLTGLRWREASAIGILMNTRGLVELVVLNIGLDIGVLSPTLFTMLVIMALVTTFATSPLLRLIDPRQELARELIHEPLYNPVSEGSAPFTIMMCVSRPAAGPGLAQIAAALRGPSKAFTRFFALHLWEATDRPSVEMRRNGPAGKSPLEPLLGAAHRLEMEIRPLSFVSTEPAVDICRTAEAKQASLLLMGEHRPLLLDGNLDGTVRGVIADASCEVAVLIERGLHKADAALVVFANRHEDLSALKVALHLHATPGKRLTLLHVVPPGAAKGRSGTQSLTIPHALEHLAEYCRTAANETLAAGIKKLSRQAWNGTEKISLQLVEHESPPDAVLSEAAAGHDLMIMGVHGNRGLGAGIISGQRRRILAEASVSILAVHPPLEVRFEESADTGPSGIPTASIRQP